MSLGANTSTSIKTYDITKSGYTAIGAIGLDFAGTHGECLSFSKLSISSNTLTYLIANNGNENASGISVNVVILYVKS